MTNNLRIHVARRAPRLPRDHFAGRPQISAIQRTMRGISIAAVVTYFVALWFWG